MWTPLSLTAASLTSGANGVKLLLTLVALLFDAAMTQRGPLTSP
jgi:hypothetical protein